MHGQVQPDACVCAEKPVAIGDQDLLDAFSVGRRDLVYPGIEPSGDLVCPADQTNFSLDRDRPGIDRNRRVARELIWFRLVGFVELTALSDTSRRSPGERHEVIDIGDIRIRVCRALTARHPDARALIDAGDRVFDALVVEDQLKGLVTFPEELGPVAAPRERGAERLSRFARADRRPARDCCSDDRPPLPLKRSDGTTFSRR
jgi:hypothetical protein